MKENKLQPRLLYPARISFKYEGEFKSFTDKKKLREFTTTKPALQQILKDLFQTGNTETLYERKPKTTKQMAMGTYLSITTLKVNGLNAPTKRQRLAEQIQKQDPYIRCIQETHLHSCCTSLHQFPFFPLYQFPFSPHPLQHLLLVDFWIAAILTGV